MAYIPSQDHLEVYTKLFDKGFSYSQIQEYFENSLGINQKKFDEGLAYFFMYTKQHIKEAGPKYEIPLTTALEEQFVKLVAGGMAWDKAAKIMNVPLPVVTELWFKKHPLFKARVDFTVEMANALVVTAMHRRAVGEIKRLKTKTVIKDKSGHTLTITEQEREEYIMPSVEAGKFWLSNKNPEMWSVDGSGLKAGNKSKILAAIEDMSIMTDEDREQLSNDEAAS